MNIFRMIQSWSDNHQPNKYALKPFLLKDGKRHPFAVICPGGGYGAVCSAGEGRAFAEELNKLGYHAFVVYYHVKKKARYPQPQEDLKRAIEEVFAHADEWKLDTSSWSIWGSSAGGHLVASFAMEKWGTPKPTALILCYPVISMGKYTHGGSRDNLLGKDAGEAMVKKLSVELNVSSDYPPTFTWYGTADDCVLPVNSKMLCESLTKVGVPCRMEEYEGIGHGVGLAKGTVAEPWFKNAVSFWESQSGKQEFDGNEEMTDAQKETLRFYTTNDFLLINGLLWGENEKTIDRFIQLINDDGRAVMAEAVEQGFDVRWNCSKEEGDRLYQIYQKRFPIIDNQDIKNQILERARDDISNMMSCMNPLAAELVLYRNIHPAFVKNLEQGMTFKHLGFSSCSLCPHIAENATYGSNECTLVEIIAPAGTPAIRLDLMPYVQNEPDEVILAPTEFLVTKVDRESNKIYMTCCKQSD